MVVPIEVNMVVLFSSLTLALTTVPCGTASASTLESSPWCKKVSIELVSLSLLTLSNHQGNFSPLVISVGIIICGVVFIISITIIAIICLKRKKSFADDLKKNNVANGQLNGHKGTHFHTDSGSSGADSDLKAEIRTTSSMSQHYYPETESNDGKQVVENIYSYNETHNGLNLISSGMSLAHNGIPFPPMCHVI